MENQDAIKKMEKEMTRLRKELDGAKLEIKTSQNESLICDDTMKIDILGTEYRIEIHKVSEDSYMEKKGLAGYCEEENKLIVVADMSEEKYFVGMDEKAQETYRKKTLRHEIMHAFLNESGLSIVQIGLMVHGQRMRKWLTGLQFKPRKSFLRSRK